MTLGTDVSGLTTTAATAAAQGLSIVVPLYNEAAGLALLHERLSRLAKTLRQNYGLDCEVVYVDDGSTDATLTIARGLAADAPAPRAQSLLQGARKLDRFPPNPRRLRTCAARPRHHQVQRRPAGGAFD